jgi:hypothetical protein
VWPELRHLAPETVEALAALERCAAESALEAAAARQRVRFAERRAAALARCGIPWGEVSQPPAILELDPHPLSRGLEAYASSRLHRGAGL